MVRWRKGMWGRKGRHIQFLKSQLTEAFYSIKWRDRMLETYRKEIEELRRDNDELGRINTEDTCNTGTETEAGGV
jgi:hypothetical protein